MVSGIGAGVRIRRGPAVVSMSPVISTGRGHVASRSSSPRLGWLRSPTDRVPTPFVLLGFRRWE